MARPHRDFEEHLEDDLKRLFDPYAAGSIPAWQEPAQTRGVRPLRGGLAVATGAAVALLALGAGSGIAVTHSVNPVDWARQVTHPAQPAPQPHPARTSPAAVATPSPRIVVSAPALPSVSPPPLPSVKPSVPSLPTPRPTLP